MTKTSFQLLKILLNFMIEKMVFNKPCRLLKRQEKVAIEYDFIFAIYFLVDNIYQC